MTKKKPITSENVKDVINQTKTAEGVAEQTGYSEKTVQKKVKQGKLKLGFTQDTGDANPPPVEQGQAEGIGTKPVLDYYATAYGFVTFVDTILWFCAKVSQGALEYERLDEKEKEICANALKAEEKVLEILASQAWAIHVVVLMQLVGVFSTKIKFRKKPKKPKDDKPAEPTKTTMKKDALKEVTKPKDKGISTAFIPMGDATEVSPEVERSEEDVSFLETKDVGNFDASDKDSQFVTPEIHDENYGNPPKDSKGLRK